MRKRIENNTVEMKAGRIDQACLRYNLGRDSMRKLAEDAGAIIRIGKCVLVNFTKLDTYLDSISL